MLAEAKQFNQIIYIPRIELKIVATQASRELSLQEQSALDRTAKYLESLGKYTDLVQRTSDKSGEIFAGRKSKIIKESLLFHTLRVVEGIAPYSSEEGIAAGFLHDGPEDTDYTLEMIKKDFGEKVWEIDDELTEQHFAERVPKDAPQAVKEADWDRRKEAQRLKVPAMQEISRLLLTENMNDNIEERLLREYAIFGEEIFQYLTVGKIKQLKRYHALKEALSPYKESNPRYSKFEKNLEKLSEVWSPIS